MADDSKTPEAGKPAGLDQANAKVADKDRPENDQKSLDERLDDGLEETFPSSDPVSVKITK